MCVYAISIIYVIIQEYHDEGLQWQDIKYFDNKPVVTLMDSKQPPGTFTKRP
jgi:myosin heavy subunit